MAFSLSRRTLYFQDGSPKLLLTDVNGVSCCLERWLNLLQWFFSHLPPHLLYITIRRNFEPRPTRPHSAGRWVINCPPAFDDSPYISRCIAPAKRQQSKRVHMVGPGNMSPVLVGCYEAKGVLWHLKIQHRNIVKHWHLFSGFFISARCHKNASSGEEVHYKHFFPQISNVVPFILSL